MNVNTLDCVVYKLVQLDQIKNPILILLLILIESFPFCFKRLKLDARIIKDPDLFVIMKYITGKK